MATLVSSNLTTGFVDLATYDELEKYMYGGPEANAYFVRKIQKSTWATQIPTILQSINGTGQFNSQVSYNISRAGDYLLQVWLRVRFPQVTANLTGSTFGANTRIRWTRNLMHNLIAGGGANNAGAGLSFNQLTAQQFDSYFLDFWAAFTVPAGKRNGYNNMIGNIASLTNPTYSAVAANTLPAATLNLPLPFFFSRDSGVALPTAALPYNEMHIDLQFRDWTQLLIVDSVGGASGGVSTNATLNDVVGGAPQLVFAQCYANYAIVSNDERKRMGAAPRDILIEQVQTAPILAITPTTNPSPSFDIRFSQAVKALFFAIRNTTNAAEWSNYTNGSPVVLTAPVGGINFSPAGGTDPYESCQLLYENTTRLNMGVDYYSLVNPFFSAVSIPLETGYHLYSYALDLVAIDPMLSTNYGKLTNVSIAPILSPDCVAAASSTGTLASPNPTLLLNGWGLSQKFAHICVAVNHNVIRISGGALGFPVL